MAKSKKGASKKTSERKIAGQVGRLLEGRLSKRYAIRIGKSLLYKVEVDTSGKLMPGNVTLPMRGQYAFQTDILVENEATGVPLVAIELKCRSFSSHDIITYSAKSERHKMIYPYLRYGFIVVGVEGLGRRFLTHRRGIDFALAFPGSTLNEDDLLAVVKKQIVSAERLRSLLKSRRVTLSRYEEAVQCAG